jgi:cytochrome c556
VGLLAIAAFESAGISAEDPAAIVAKRQEFMKQNGGHMKAINDFLENGQGTAADVVTHAEALQARAKEIAALFPEGTSADDLPGKSYAKPDVWAKWAEFEAAANGLGSEAGKLAEVAKGGDNAAIAEQFGLTGKNGCGGCHTPFRIKKDG